MSKKAATSGTLRTTAAICAGFTFFWVSIYAFGEMIASERFISPLMTAELLLQDFRMRHGKPAPTDPRVVFLGFDQQVEDRPFPEEVVESPTLGLMQQNWPWSREVWAAAIDRLVGAGAKVVVIDLLFPNPGQGDRALEEALYRHADHVVLGYNIVHSATQGLRETSIYPSDTVIRSVHEARSILAYVNFYPDVDDVIRRTTFRRIDPTLDAGGSTETYSLAAKALIKAGWDQHLPREFRQYRFRYAGGPNTVFTYRPIYEIFAKAVWETNYQNGAFFKDKIVIIGPAANWTQDLQKSPYLTDMFGPEVHANALNAALTGSFIHEPTPVTHMGIIAGLGLLVFALMAGIVQPLHRLGALAAANLAYLSGIHLAYEQFGWMVVAIAPLLTINTAGAGCLFHQLLMDRLEKARTRASFEKYVSANVVQSMLDRAEEFDEIRKGTRLPCTMLFSDLRGFTTLTESADSKALVVQLNEYFSEMVEAVFRHDGTLDKFIGDAVMAVWGNVTSAGRETDARNAVHTALDMLDSLDTLNTRWATQGRGAFHIGIGINHGDVIAADMGSAKKKEFTVIGDAVNLASRLEGVTKNYGLALVLGESVADMVRGEFPLQTVDLIQVKGKTRPVDTFTVIRGIHDSTALETYERAVGLYREGNFTAALAQFESILPVWKHNELPGIYVERCRELIAHPPAAWDGVFVMKTK